MTLIIRYASTIMGTKRASPDYELACSISMILDIGTLSSKLPLTHLVVEAALRRSVLEQNWQMEACIT